MPSWGQRTLAASKASWNRDQLWMTRSMLLAVAPVMTLPYLQDRRRRALQDLVDIGLRQANFADPGEGALVRLVGQQHREVTAGQDVLGAERLPGARQRRVRAVANGVVVEAPRGDAGRLRQVPLAHRELIVETLQEHRDEAAEVRNNVGDMGELRRDLLGNEVQRDHR